MNPSEDKTQDIADSFSPHFVEVLFSEVYRGRIRFQSTILVVAVVGIFSNVSPKQKTTLYATSKQNQPIPDFADKQNCLSTEMASPSSSLRFVVDVS